MRTPTSGVETVSTVEGSAQVMGFDPTAMGMILDMLSNLYSDPALAVVREYSSNAYDSHVEAGNPDPILVTSPSHFNPVLTVQDFGVGLSRDEVLNVYACYGASTKRGCRSKIVRCKDGKCADCQRADTQIGAFGVGAKSAFAVGGQFTVTAVKDGLQTIALFALNSDGAPTVNIIAYGATLEPNGVKVEIGVKDVSAVNRAIERLFATWKPGTVMVDGICPPSIWDDLSPVTEDIQVTWRKDRYGDPVAFVIVMGGVPYALTDAASNSLPPRMHTIARAVQASNLKVYLTVPIGAVDITPSREELRVTPKTVETVAALIEKFNQYLGPWISDQIADSKSRIAAIIKFHQVSQMLGALTHQIQSVLNNVTWNGQPLNRSVIDYPGTQWFELSRRGYSSAYNARRNRDLRLHPTNEIERLLFVTNVPERRVRSVQLAAKAYLMDWDDRNAKVVALTGPEASYTKEWFDLSDPALKKIDYDSFIKQWKPAPSPAQRGETLYEADGVLTTVAELNEFDEVFYLTNHDRKTISSVFRPLLRAAVGDGILVTLKPTQKAEALVKRVPSAVNAGAEMTVHATKILSNLTQADADIVAAGVLIDKMDRQITGFLHKHKDKITNQTVLKVVAQYKRAGELNPGGSDRRRVLLLAARYLGRTLTTGTSALDPADYEKMIAGLPLLTIYFERSWHRSGLADQHMIDYINSVKL